MKTKFVPLGQVCNNEECSWYELGYSKKYNRLDHTYKPNGESS